ncbi:interferon-induced protein with tetratricopeptide repeats 5-like [Solea solea]|uniref:interferon-induced protein with tetratricopeptide repeats 5-like n=1 Tax=Solea solea TaxID=90069 RepID=UPI00272CDD2F|nr:interferon-induced protein with tetratricopeptide repeats 5-like [Solea solea]
MSAAKSETTLEAKLKKLQCHFTWDLGDNKTKLLRLSETLQDIGTDEGNCWLGHIYNLQGYIHFQLGTDEADKARSFFSKATEALNRTRDADRGPWLLVNYGNLAWLHYLQGEEAESQAYLSKVTALMEEFPSPSQDELHPEICAEKAWTLLKFSREQKLLAGEYFQKAIEMQPDMVAWQTSHLLGLASIHKHNENELEADFMERMQNAKEQDPENLYLAAVCLKQRASRGEDVEDEASELATKILGNPVSSYSGIKVILRIYRGNDSFARATALAEEALQNHPDERYLKRCLALCYKWKINSRGSRPTPQMIDKAISLHKQVISLYPHSSFVKRMDLANVYAKSPHGLGEAEDIYRELLKRDLQPADKQVLYNTYAKFLNFERQDRNGSVDYHMRAAKIPHESFYRQNSIKALEKIRDRGRNRRGREIEQFLDRL